MKKIFLGGLPKHFTDEKLREMFCNYGEITDYVVMKDPHSKESRGFGFIEFSSEEPANQVIKNRPHMVDGREIEVRRAMPKDITHTTIHERTKRVFIGGLNYDVTEEDIRKYYNEKFGKYGRVESVEVKRDRESNHSRGFAFITFDSEDTVDVVLILEPKPIKFGRNCEVKKSEPRRTDDSYRRSSRNRRRSPIRPRTRYAADEEYSRYSRHDDYDRRRPYRFPDDSRSLPPNPEYVPPPAPYRHERAYERSPVYRRYPANEQSNGYPQASPYDRGYPYADYHNSFSHQYSPTYDNPNTSRTHHGSSSNQVPPNRPSPTMGYVQRPPPQYRQYEPGYRDRDTNPY